MGLGPEGRRIANHQDSSALIRRPIGTEPITGECHGILGSLHELFKEKGIPATREGSGLPGLHHNLTQILSDLAGIAMLPQQVIAHAPGSERLISAITEFANNLSDALKGNGGRDLKAAGALLTRLQEQLGIEPQKARLSSISLPKLPWK